MTKRLLSDTDPCAEEGEGGCGCAAPKPKKLRKEGALHPETDENEDATSDETWSPSSSEDGDDEDADEETEEQDEKEPVAPKPPTRRTLRSSGPVVRPGDEMHAVMDKIDEVIDNESDFSSTTEEEEEEDEESEDDGEEEEEDESDTEEDGYSDDDSFVTSGDEDDEEDEIEETDPDAPPKMLDPITTDEILADFASPPGPPPAPAEKA